MLTKTAFDLLKKTYNSWNEDNAPRLGAALSYYTIFSIAPLLVIATAIAGVALGHDAVQGQLKETLTGTLGQNGAQAVEGMVTSANRSGTGTVATVAGIIMLIAGASGVFAELQGSLNTIWGVVPKKDRGVWAVIQDRFLSVVMALGTAFLLLVSLVVSAVLAGVGKYLSGSLPGGEMLWSAVNSVVSFGVVALMFALLFKYLPDAKTHWKDIWIGALATAALFVVGKTVIGLYLGRTSVSSAYGAAGSLAIVLLWVYYVAQIFFFGAEFTKVYAGTHGSRVIPAKNAVPVTEEARAQQGIPHRDGQGGPV